MNKHKVFIGSSVDGLIYAQCLAEQLNTTKKYEAIDWGEYFRTKAGGKISLTALFDALKDYEIALFFVTKDYFIDNWELDPTTSKVKKSHSTSDYFGSKPNVWFELGMFMGRLNEEKVLFIVEDDDNKLRPLMTLSDLYGLNPITYTLSNDVKEEIISYSRVCQKSKKQQKLSDLKLSVKNKLAKSIKDLVKLQFSQPSKFKTPSNYYTVQQLFSREQCYDEGFKIIREANNRVFTILSYENEMTPTDPKYRMGLWPEIKKKIKKYKTKNIIKQQDFKEVFKRYMNLANNDIASQANEILNDFPNEIEIRDTYCNYIETVITDNKVLLVLPNPKGKNISVEAGILIHSKVVADEFAEWFCKLLPEPNEIIIDSKKKLKDYRSFIWDEPSKRIELNGSRCNACFIRFNNQPDNVKFKLKSKGLK